MVSKNKGLQALLISAVTSGLLAAAPLVTAEEMDHSKHGGMDHSKHAGMDHSQAAQASEHVHHAHGAGQWMFEYRYMTMEMEDLLDGTDSVSTNEVSGVTAMTGMCMMIKDPTKPYCMAPTDMTMDMHMLMAMYGLDDKISLMAMFNYLSNDMDMVMHVDTGMMQMDMEMEMDTSGMGDTQVGVMYKIDKAMTAALSVSIPTGSIDEEVEMMGNDMQAPYAMQLGTGTYDLIPSITYNASANQWAYGGQAEYRYHIGENDNEYTRGNKLKLGGWGKYAINKTVSASGRLDYMKEDAIDGEDPDIMVMMAPTSDPDNYGGTRIDATLGVIGMFGGHTLGLAYTKPLKQDTNGPQMELQSIVTLSWMYMM